MKQRVLIFTGDGKGKTTAAMGMALRAVGHGMNVRIVQFIKSDASSGEIAAFAAFPKVCLTQHGCGFVPAKGSPSFARHCEAACEGLAVAGEAVASGKYQLVVLDEIISAVQLELIEEERVLDVVRAAHENTHLALTGRGATDALFALADTATEMRCIKHALEQGVRATAGIEM